MTAVGRAWVATDTAWDDVREGEVVEWTNDRLTVVVLVERDHLELEGGWDQPIRVSRPEPGALVPVLRLRDALIGDVISDE